jgi:hypothetical protein
MLLTDRTNAKENTVALTTGNKVLIGVGATVVVIIIAIMSVFGYVNSIRNEGIAKENSLEQQYQVNQNELSTYVVSIQESLGIADKGSSKLQTILVEAVKGRYDGKMQPGTGGAMFSAITEAYPDLTATTGAYAKVQDQVTSGRTAYKNQQNKLLDQIRSYETWQEQGLIQSTVIRSIGFPSNSLEARVGDTVYKGEEALRYMKRLVLTDEAVTSYETGKTAPLIVPEAAK